MTTRIIVGNSLEVLPTLQQKVHCSVTSPPYYGLRKYDGDQVCDWPEMEYAPMPGLPPVTVEAMTCALGHEPTIEAYVGHLVAIYREVWQVLRDDGVAWVVMGDSYARQAGDDIKRGTPNTGQARIFLQGLGREGMGNNRPPTGLKQGDLMLVPHRLALALQADGWTVRNDDVWAKVAPMPESVSGWRWERHRIKVKGAPAGTRNVDNRNRQGDPARSGGYRSDVASNSTAKWTDCPGCPKCESNDGYILKRGSWRHTRAHEFVFMLSKGMGYWANQEMVREPSTGQIGAAVNFRRETKDHLIPNQTATQHRLNRFDTIDNPAGRNPRSVLSPSPEPFPGSHFAVYPTGLIEPLIKATCPTRCCPECGQGWSPVVKRRKVHCSELGINAPGRHHGRGQRRTEAQLIGKDRPHWNNMEYLGVNNVLGYRPTCSCGMAAYDAVPGVVLDLFIGSGTTGLVCDRLGLDCIGIDISERYAVDIAKERITADAPLLADVMVLADIPTPSP